MQAIRKTWVRKGFLPFPARRQKQQHPRTNHHQRMGKKRIANHPVDVDDTPSRTTTCADFICFRFFFFFFSFFVSQLVSLQARRFVRVCMRNCVQNIAPPPPPLLPSRSRSWIPSRAPVTRQVSGVGHYNSVVYHSLTVFF